MPIVGVNDLNYKDALKRVLKKMIIDDNTKCWVWTGSTDPKTGYGQVRIGQRSYKVHRFIAYCFHGLDIYDLFTDACHSCDRRNCINPSHIWLGTRSQNLRDSVRKGRWHGGSHTGKYYGKFVNNLKEKDWGNYKTATISNDKSDEREKG